MFIREEVSAWPPDMPPADAPAAATNPPAVLCFGVDTLLELNRSTHLCFSKSDEDLKPRPGPGANEERGI